MSSSTSYFCSGWILAKNGNLVNSTRESRRLFRPSMSCLIGISQVPGWASRKPLIVIIIGFSTSPQTIFVISRWFPVVGCCQIHLRLSPYVMNFFIRKFCLYSSCFLLVGWSKGFWKKRIKLWLFGAREIDFFPITNSFCQYCKFFSLWIIS